MASSTRRVAALGSLLALALSLVSCSAVRTEQAPLVEPGIRESFAGMFVGTAALQTAENLLTVRCMADKGFAFDPPPLTSDRSLPQTFGDDVETAAVAGFRSQELPTAVQPVPQELPASDAQALSDALVGPGGGTWAEVEVLGQRIAISSGGCLGGARSEIFGSAENYLLSNELLDNTIRMTMYQAVEDPEVVEAHDDWADCMAARGYERFAYREIPRNMAEEFYELYSLAEAKGKEIELAVDDAECDREANYTSIRLRAEDELLTAFLRDNEALILAARENLEASVARARKALGGS